MLICGLLFWVWVQPAPPARPEPPRPGQGPPVPAPTADALAEAAAPIYREYWWPSHDRANRTRLATLYQTPWFIERLVAAI